MSRRVLVAIVLSVAVLAVFAPYASRWYARWTLKQDAIEALPPKLKQFAYAQEFVRSACSGDGKAVTRYLRAGYSANSENEHGDRPLHCAAAIGDVAVANELLAAGADPNWITKKEEFAPIHVAAAFRRIELVKRLHEAGANINQQSAFGPPLVLAIGRIDEYRTPRGVSMDIRVRRDDAPIEVAAVEEMLRLGARADVTDPQGNTALHVAAKQLNVPVALFLLERGLNINAINRAGETPLMLAVARIRTPDNDPMTIERVAFIERLIDAGANVNARDASGESALFKAFTGPESLIDLLARRGADINVTSTSRGSIWSQGLLSSKAHRVADRFSTIGVSYLPDGKPGANPLHVYASKGDIELVRYFLDRGVPVNATDANGLTPLHVALASQISGTNNQAQQTNVIKLLLQRGANIETRDRWNETPLMKAARQPVEVIDLLLKHGAKVNAVARVDGKSKHVLEFFLHAKNTAGFERLMRAGARLPR